MELFPYNSAIAPVILAGSGIVLIALAVLRSRGILKGRDSWIPTVLVAAILCWSLVGVGRISNPWIRFENPNALVLFLAVLLIWWCGKRLTPIGRNRRRVALFLRLAVLTLLILGLARAQRVEENDDLSVYFLLDASKSVAPAMREDALKAINKVAEGMKKNDRAGMIVFGEEAGIENLPHFKFKEEKIETVPGPNATNLEGAVRLALASFPEETQRRIVIFSDMNENRGSVLDEIRVARANKVAVDIYPLGMAERKEVLVDKIDVPSQVKVDETFDVDVFLYSTHDDMPVTVRLYEDDQLINPNEKPRLITAGKSKLNMTRSLKKSGFHQFRVVVESPDDANAENNTGYGFTFVSGTPKVLFVRSDEEHDHYIPEALASENIEVEVTNSSGIPTDLAELQSYDSVILSNIHAGDMTSQQMKMFETGVRDFGIGLVVVGGDRSYGVGGYNGSPLERALPVEMEIKQKKVIPSGALVLIMHSVEIPDGQAYAREISLAALEVLSESDKIGLLLYGRGAEWLFELQEARNKAHLMSLIDGMFPGDMPDFDVTLRMAYTALKASNSNLKHIVILSDGDPSPPNQSLINQLRAERISISTVLIYPHELQSAERMMKSIADSTGGRYHLVRGPKELPQIFIKEASVIRKSLIFEGPSGPQIGQFTDSIRGIEPGEFPELYGYVATTAKDRAEVPLLSKDEYPLMAQWRFGLGRSVAFTSDGKNRWGKDWVAWQKYNKFWSQVVRWTMRSIEKGNLRVNTEIRDGVGHVVVDAYDKDNKLANYLEFQSIVADPNKDSKPFELLQTQPGRYEGTFDVGDVGNYLLNLTYTDAEGIQRQFVSGTSLSYSDEYRDIEPGWRLLKQVLETSAGRVVAANETNTPPSVLASLGGIEPINLSRIFDHNLEKTRSFHPIWPLLLLIAVLLMPIDIFVRRVILDREQVRNAALRVLEWVPIPGLTRRPVPAADPSMERLLSVKERVKARQPDRAAAEKTQTSMPAFLSERVKERTRTTVLSGGKEPVVFEEPQVAGPSAKRPAGESAFTKRLLEAKKRAREERKPKEEE